MSAFINSMLIEPVVRQARRFSYPADSNPPEPLSHATENSRREQESTRDAAQLISDSQTQNNSEPVTNRVASSWNISGLPIRYEPTPLDDPESLHSRHGNPEPLHSRSMEVLPPLDHGTGASPQDYRSYSVDHVSNISRNPTFGMPERLRGQTAMTPTPSGGFMPSVGLTSGDQNATRSREGSLGNLKMSGHLPIDDGMQPLRRKIQLIRDMALSSEEKARRMHALMVADYEAFKMSTDRAEESSRPKADGVTADIKNLALRTSDQGQISRLMSSTDVDPSRDISDGFVLSSDDLRPTYRRRRSSSASRRRLALSMKMSSTEGVEDQEDEEVSLGCKHYMRNVKIQCDACKRWYTCRHCHDENENHLLNVKSIQNMLCMLCNHPQTAGQYCSNCGELTASYYCEICKLWENDPNKRIYHCEDCGICRRGQGLGKDYVHCKVKYLMKGKGKGIY